jgi:hypothetical protein
MRFTHGKVPEETAYLVPGTICVFFNFLWMVVPGINRSQKNLKNFLALKKGYLVPG